MKDYKVNRQLIAWEIVDLVCISLMISDAELFFHISVSHLYVLSGEMSIQVLRPFKKLG